MSTICPDTWSEDQPVLYAYKVSAGACGRTGDHENHCVAVGLYANDGARFAEAHVGLEVAITLIQELQAGVDALKQHGLN